MAFNEVANLPTVVQDVLDTLGTRTGTLRVLIVDDGSSDGTSAVADHLAVADPRIQVIHHTQNQGLGGVYRTGFAACREGLLTFVPADGQYKALNVVRLLNSLDGADLALGFLPTKREGVVPHILSQLERLLYRLLLGRMPRFQGLFLVRAALVKRLELTAKGRGWAIVTEFIFKAWKIGARIETAPMVLSPRLSGQSKVQNWRTVFSSLRQLCSLAWSLKSLRCGRR